MNAFLSIELMCRSAEALSSAAVAVAVLFPALQNSRRMHCRYNMITISNRLRTHRILKQDHKYPETLDTLEPIHDAIPLCPDGGKYSFTISDGTMSGMNCHIVPSGQRIIKCTCEEHGIYGVDADTD